jgi:hypothetical protein
MAEPCWRCAKLGDAPAAPSALAVPAATVLIIVTGVVAAWYLTQRRSRSWYSEDRLTKKQWRQVQRLRAKVNQKRRRRS